MDHKILVIIPAYNAGIFLRETVNSIKNQQGVNVEIIIIDDCSTDNTYIIAKSLDVSKVYKNDVNMGNYYSCNFVLWNHIKDKSWTHLVFHGADDVSYQSRFKKQLNSFDDKTLGVGCRFNRVDYKTKRRIKTNPKTNESMMMFKREVFEIFGYRDTGRAGCDTEFKRRILMARPGSIKPLNEILVDAYIHDNNLTKRIPIGGTYRKNYVSKFTKDHEIMKKNNNFYKDFTP